MLDGVSFYTSTSPLVWAYKQINVGKSHRPAGETKKFMRFAEPTGRVQLCQTRFRFIPLPDSKTRPPALALLFGWKLHAPLTFPASF